MILICHFELMAKSDKKNISKNLKLLRNAAGLSQHDFSSLVDISKRTIANVESGKTSHNLDVLEKILTFFNYEFEDIRIKEIEIPIDFRERLINYHSKNKHLSNLLNHPPTIVYAIEFKLLKSEFIDHPKEISQIKYFFQKFGWTYNGTSISNALKRRPDLIEIRKHESKRNTNIYLSRKLPKE